MSGSVIALGFFDGVHLGHAALLRRTVEEAARREKAEAEKAEASALKKLEAAEAAAATKRPAKEVAPRRSAVFVTPLNSAPPPPEFTGSQGKPAASSRSWRGAAATPPCRTWSCRHRRCLGARKANSRQTRPCRRLKTRPWQGYSFKSARQRATVLRRRLRRHAPWRPAPPARRSQTPKRRAPRPLGGCEEAAQGH